MQNVLGYLLVFIAVPAGLVATVLSLFAIAIMSCYLYGFPTVAVTDAFGFVRLRWRLIGVLFVIAGAAVTALAALDDARLFTGRAPRQLPTWDKAVQSDLAKDLPTTDELIDRELAKADYHKCITYGFKAGTDAYAQCRMQLDQKRLHNE